MLLANKVFLLHSPQRLPPAEIAGARFKMDQYNYGKAFSVVLHVPDVVGTLRLVRMSYVVECLLVISIMFLKSTRCQSDVLCNLAALINFTSAL
mgnify:CR=1 FL=1